jgi:predicted GNAT family acetyltransferase
VTAESPDLAAVVGAVRAAFAGSDDADLREPVAEKRLLRQDMVRMIGAYDDHGVVGGGTHSPRGSATEITGIGVLPRARRRGLGAALTAALAEDARGNGARTIFLSAGDEAASRVYQAVGFRRVGTACIAEPSR